MSNDLVSPDQAAQMAALRTKNIMELEAWLRANHGHPEADAAFVTLLVLDRQVDHYRNIVDSGEPGPDWDGAL